MVNISVAEDGIITLGNRFGRSSLRGSARGPLRGAEQGVEAGARAVGLTPKWALRRQRPSSGAARETVSRSGHLGAADPVKLVYVRDEQGAVRLAWNVTILEPGAPHYWDVSTDVDGRPDCED